MRSEKPIYSAKEVVEILEKARDLGVTEIRLEGFEASFKLAPQSTSSALPTRRLTDREEPKPEFEEPGYICEECGAEKVEGIYGLYCRRCYLKRKEERWQKTRKW